MSNEERYKTRNERLFALILRIQSKPNQTARSLADYFGVTERTIYRDLEVLARSDIPITYGEKRGYALVEGFTLPPLSFTSREAVAMLTGLALLRLQPDAALHADADRVEAKVTQVFAGPLVRFLKALQDKVVVDPYEQVHLPEPSTLTPWFTLAEAAVQRKRVRMVYHVETRNEDTERHIDPLVLVYFGFRWNVIAFDHLRNEVRNFRLDAIRALDVLQTTFTPPDFDLSTYLATRNDREGGHPIRLAFTQRAWTRASRELPAPLLEEYAQDQEYHIAFRFDNLEFLAGWLLQFGTEVQVLAPDTLRTTLYDLVSRVARHHAPS